MLCYVTLSESDWWRPVFRDWIVIFKIENLSPLLLRYILVYARAWKVHINQLRATPWEIGLGYIIIIERGNGEWWELISMIDMVNHQRILLDCKLWNPSILFVSVDWMGSLGIGFRWSRLIIGRCPMLCDVTLSESGRCRSLFRDRIASYEIQNRSPFSIFIVISAQAWKAHIIHHKKRPILFFYLTTHVSGPCIRASKSGSLRSRAASFWIATPSS